MASVSDSLLHNSRARNLADSTALEDLGRGPSITQLKQGGAFIANGEPQLLPNAAASWRARQRWATRTALCGYYGSLRFRLADGVELALSQFLEYAAGAEAVRCERLAARFAAKEAVLKALGTGLRSGMEWTDIVVVRDELGAPSIRLGGRVAEVAASKGIEAWQLSLSHAGGFAMASVLALGPAAD